MLTRAKNKIQISCDECGEPMRNNAGKELIYNHDEFDVMISDLHDQSWITTRDGNIYTHICPDCQED